MSRSLSIPLITAAALVGTCPAVLHGSGTRVGFKDAYATARGNAFVATADNPSAIYYNPAGITQLEGAQVSANVYAVSLSSDYRGPGGQASLDEDAVAVPSLYATWKADDAPWALGLGVYAPFGLETEWNAGSPLSPFATRNEQSVRTYNLTAAWTVSPALSVGGALTWNHLTTDLRQVPVPGVPFRFEGEGDALGANVGALWRLNERHQFGLSYSHHNRITAEGTSRLGVTESAEATFAFPEVVIAGWSYRPTPVWNLEINVDWTNWERLNAVTIRKPSGPLNLPFHWEPGFFYELGATRMIGDFALSAGYCFTENSVPDASYTPAVPDSHRSFYSLGVGYRGERLTLDLAWHYADGGDRSVSGSPAALIPGATADGSYRNALQALSLSAGLRF